VECTDQFYRNRKSKPAFQALRRAIGNLEFIARLRSIPRAKNGDLRLVARERARESRRLNRGNVRARYGKGGFSRNAKKIADDKVAAFLHPSWPGTGKAADLTVMAMLCQMSAFRTVG